MYTCEKLTNQLQVTCNKPPLTLYLKHELMTKGSNAMGVFVNPECSAFKAAASSEIYAI